MGAIRLDSATLLEVAPKVDASEDWVPAVLDLLSTQRIDLTGARLAGFAPERKNILEVLAHAYAAHLSRALTRDGPLTLLRRVNEDNQVLKGKLQVTQWLPRAIIRPIPFPVSFDSLETDNDFTIVLALIARYLAGMTSSLSLHSELLRLESELRPGAPPAHSFNSAALERPLPPQWFIYRPAWSIAVAILSRRSLLGPRGKLMGLEVVIEAWPLLETLLTRALGAASKLDIPGEAPPRVIPKRRDVLLINRTSGDVRKVEPDGRLLRSDGTVVTFEAKLSRRSQYGWPAEDHVYQALSTAAACGSALAVLVYPETFDPVWWDVNGFANYPGHLVAVGLGLYSYRVGSGDRERGGRVRDLLRSRDAKGGYIAA